MAYFTLLLGDRDVTQKSKDGIRVGLALVGLVSVLVGNLLACGFMVGRIDQKVDTLRESEASQVARDEKQSSEIKRLSEDAMFMKGQLTAELQGLRRDMDRVITCIENLELADGEN